MSAPLRTGGVWDALAVLALVAPLVGVIAALGRSRNPISVAAASRAGALLAAATWVGLLVAGAAPTFGSFHPDGPAVAVAAGAALLAAAVADAGVRVLDQPTAGSRGAVVAAPVLASAVALGVGFAGSGAGLGRGVASALVIGAAVVTALLVGLAGPSGRSSPGLVVATVTLPAFLLAGVRGAATLALAGVPTPVAVATAGLAVVAAVAVAGDLLEPGAVLGPLALAVAVAPVDVAAPAAGLLAAAAVLVAVAGEPWALLAAVPGSALVAGALADVPALDTDVTAAFALTAALAAVVTGVSVTLRSPRPSWAAPGPVGVVAAVLVAWVVVVPGSWRWAVADAGVLASWDRAAAVAAAAGLVALGANEALVAARDPDRRPAGQ